MQVMAELERLDEPGRLVLIPLHSQVAREEQQQIFQRFGAGLRKVIVATNIAESSLTVPDVRYVVDCGLMRESQYDPTTQLESLQTVLASKASTTQRCGRAGRLGPGLAFVLYPRRWWDGGETPAHALSEMQRRPLERLVLQVSWPCGCGWRGSWVSVHDISTG
jgi:HrpA-like RNA helicase